MRMRVHWTPALDERLKRLRTAGLTWDAIALEMELGRYTVLERGRKIGARRQIVRPALPVTEAADRPPRPPGHPLTWGLINEGTLLAGEPYPYPVFL